MVVRLSDKVFFYFKIIRCFRPVFPFVVFISSAIILPNRQPEVEQAYIADNTQQTNYENNIHEFMWHLFVVFFLLMLPPCLRFPPYCFRSVFSVYCFVLFKAISYQQHKVCFCLCIMIVLKSINTIYSIQLASHLNISNLFYFDANQNANIINNNNNKL